MKVLKTFFITLAVVLAVGVLFLVGRGMLKTDTFGGGLSDTTRSEAEKDSSGDSEGGYGSQESKDGAGPGSDFAGKTSNSGEKKSSANPIVKAVVNEAIDVYIDNADGEVKEVAESMSEEDRETVTEIIAENVSLDAIPQIQSFLSSGDKDSILEYAEENFTQEQIEQLQSIMSKYVSE